MGIHRKSHLARSFVVLLGAVLVLAGAGFAAARTMGGAPWTQPLLSSASCDQGENAGTTQGTTDDSTEATTSTTDVTAATSPTDDAAVTDGEPSTGSQDESADDPTDSQDESADDSTQDESADDPTTESDATEPAADVMCTSTDTQQTPEDTQAFFEQFSQQCGQAVLGDAKLTDTGTDSATADAYASLADALNSGQVDHMVQSARVLLRNCEAHANDGLRNALYHHGLNWLRHYQHELWLEQKFADKWPDGKPGGGADHEAHGKPDQRKGNGHNNGQKEHGNPHDAGPSSAPGGGSSSGHGNGNAFGHSK